jgi:sarcosine oxidase gamma subunit
MKRFVLTVTAGLLSVIAATAAARGKSRECKPSGNPNQLGASGAIAVAQPVQYWEQPWLLVADKTVKADKVRLIGGNGEIIEIGKPPATVEPIIWLARGRGVYALGKARSLTTGKTDVVLMRWGSDPRPHLTVLSSSDTIGGQLSAAFLDEFLAVTWAETGADKQLHRMVGFLDSEAPRVPTPQDLGPDSGVAARVQANGRAFTVLWTGGEQLMRANFDLHGKATSPVAKLALTNASGVRAVAQCAQRSWLVVDAKGELALASTDGAAPVAELARLPSSPGAELLPIECVDDGIVLGRRTLDVKGGNIVFWASTVDASGKIHDRRIRDMRGTSDTIRIPQFSLIGGKLTTWWIEGQGLETKVWSRLLSCE